MLWGVALWLRLRERLVIASLAGCGFAVLIFFCHGFAFALYGLVLALLEFGRWLETRPRRLGALVLAAIAVGVQAVVPAILFAMAKTSSAGKSAGDRLLAQTQAHNLEHRVVALVTHQGLAILRVANSPFLLLDVLTFLVAGALLFAAWRRGAIGVARFAVPVLLVFAVLCFITPPSLFGVGKISDRVPLVTLLLFAGLIRPLARQAAAWLWLVRGLAAIFAVRLIVTIATFAGYQSDFADYAAVARADSAARDRRLGLARRVAQARPGRDALPDVRAADGRAVRGTAAAVRDPLAATDAAARRACRPQRRRGRAGAVDDRSAGRPGAGVRVLPRLRLSRAAHRPLHRARAPGPLRAAQGGAHAMTRAWPLADVCSQPVRGFPLRALGRGR